MNETPPNAQDSRVHRWVQQLHTEGNDLHTKLGENFAYYLDHVEALENGELDYLNLPHFNAPDKAVIHAATMFGLSWGKTSELYVVLDEDNTFLELFGIRENAERYATLTALNDQPEPTDLERFFIETFTADDLDDLLDDISTVSEDGHLDRFLRELPSSPDYSDVIGEFNTVVEQLQDAAETASVNTVTTVTPNGKAPEADIADMKSGSSEILPKTGACLEHLYDNVEAFESGSTERVIEGMPHFTENTKWMIAFSALFGRLWEFSDPALWIVCEEDASFVGLYASPTLAAQAAHEHPGRYTEAITPRDNDRHSELSHSVL